MAHGYSAIVHSILNARPHNEKDNTSLQQIHSAMGMAGSLGKMTRLLFVNPTDLSQSDRLKLKEVLGDFYFYYTGFCQSMGISPDFHYQRQMESACMTINGVYHEFEDAALRVVHMTKEMMFERVPHPSAEFTAPLKRTYVLFLQLVDNLDFTGLNGIKTDNIRKIQRKRAPGSFSQYEGKSHAS